MQERGRLALSGKARKKLLHRVTTNDIESLSPGEGRPTLLVTAKGRLVDRLMALDTGETLRVITSDGGRETVSEALRKYVVFEDVRIEDETETTFLVGLYGPRAEEILERVAGEPADDTAAAAALLPRELFHGRDVDLAGSGVTVVREHGFSGPAFLIQGRGEDRERVGAALEAGGAHTGPPAEMREAFEALRIEAGLPAYGREISADWNPLEARQEDAVSFSKGCYVGQEVIARLRTYDKVKRHLVRMVIEGDEPVLQGANCRAGSSGGLVTSAAVVPGGDAVVALGMLDRDVDADGGELRVEIAGNERRARLAGAPPTARDVRVAPPPAAPAPGRQRFGG
jgi:folate-binding protein YgfZ